MKTNKQKCLDMWEWLAENPTQGKEEYGNYLITVGRMKEFCQCWACAEDALNQRKEDKNCVNCPIDFPLNSKGIKDCMLVSSPYSDWHYTNSYTDAEKAAQAMIKLIKTTWKEQKEL